MAKECDTFIANINGLDLSDAINVCRFCLENYDYATSPCDGDFEKYESMFTDTFGIELKHKEENLEFKKPICSKCVHKIQEAYTFKNEALFIEQIYYERIKKWRQNIKIKECHDDNMADDDLYPDIKEYEDKDNCDYESPKITKTRKKTKEMCTRKLDIKNEKLDGRSPGTILRENSLRIIKNSTACVFQWNKSYYCCFCCKKPFSNIPQLKEHTRTHTIDEINQKIIKQQNTLIKFEISDLTCTLCNGKFENLTDFERHLSNKHSIFVSPHILAPFKINDSLKCQICHEKFDAFRLLNIHTNRHYQNQICHVCGAGFSNSIFLNLHKRRSHRKIACKKCNLTFPNKNDLKKHNVTVHSLKYERKARFPCQFCSDRFYQENYKVLHLIEKHGIKKPEFKCDICSKIYITRSILNNHIKLVHKKEKIHECDICHGFFYTKFDLGRHRQTHTGQKKFCCSVCNNLFASKDSLRRHTKRSHISIH